MRALVVGCGRVGAALALKLHAGGWEVAVVDSSEEALGRLGERWPGEFHLGHALDAAVLERARIGECDAVIVSTSGDNTNIVVAQVAKLRYEVPAVATRILDPARAAFFSDRGFDVVSPTSAAIATLEEWVGNLQAPA